MEFNWKLNDEESIFVHNMYGSYETVKFLKIWDIDQRDKKFPNLVSTDKDSDTYNADWWINKMVAHVQEMKKAFDTECTGNLMMVLGHDFVWGNAHQLYYSYD